jgi:hypothetical protein
VIVNGIGYTDQMMGILSNMLAD